MIIAGNFNRVFKSEIRLVLSFFFIILFTLFTIEILWFVPSAICGNEVDILKPSQPEGASPFEYLKSVKRHALLTAETHNFPTGSY